ncbi:MAG: hypothetical protein V4564_20780 [Pseudomonadota bacterium]|uniref:hypothetical protein n=1 Tax=Sphingomonas sp. ERG5 TaxID=1381597 RepID=UPI00054BCE39|nr:hypothetical protein [Sphingomonas sp. ERG5]
MSRDTDASTLLTRAIERESQEAGCPAAISTATWTPWASATFSGARHLVSLTASASSALDEWLAALPEADIDVRGHLLASMAVNSLRRSENTVTIELEALTIEE